MRAGARSYSFPDALAGPGMESAPLFFSSFEVIMRMASASPALGTSTQFKKQSAMVEE